MSEPSSPSIDAVDLTGDRYVVEQNLVRNKYRAYDDDGTVVLRGKQKLFRMKEEFPFEAGDGTDAFTVKAGGIVDVAGNYLLSDAQTGEELVVLDNDFSVFQDVWRIRDAATEEILAKITSRGAAITLARNVIPFGEVIPHKYEITDGTGGHVGRIEGEFAIKDRYEIRIDDAGDVPTEAVVASAMVIDAIQGN